VQFKDSYQPAAQKPLGEHPVLVIGLVMNQNDDQTAIEFQLLTGQSVNLNLPQTVLHLMVTLLTKLQDTAAWGVGQTALAATDTAPVPPTSHQVH
jgi:hypothetical protein